MGKKTTLLKISSFILLSGSLFFLMAFQTNDITITQDNLTNVVCPEGSTGSISVTVSGGTGTLSYSWTGPGTFTSSSEDISNLLAGTYTLTVTDQTTPTPVTKTAEFIIIQEDLIKPTLSAPSDITLSADSGVCTASNISLGTPVFDDNCAVSSLENDAPTDFPLGNTTVTWTARDASGNATTDTQLVTINDTEGPVVITKDFSISLDANGSASITAVNVDNGSTDNCGISSYSLSKSSFNCANLGANSVTLTVTDNHGNSTSGSAVVTVIDDTPPVVQTQNITVELDASGNATIAENAVDLGSSDACGNLTFDTNQTTFNCTNLGQNTVTLTVTDASNNSASKTAVVTVVDEIAPVVQTQDITVQLDASGNAIIAEDAVNFGSSDACGPLTFSTSKTSFNCTEVGANTVTLTVTDAQGNSATKNAIVTVEDNQNPIISSVTTITAGTDPGLCTAIIAIPLPSVGNNCEAPVPTGTRSDGQPLDAPYPVGNTIITWKATDKNGNMAVDVQQTVTVSDGEAPVVPQLDTIVWGCEYTVTPPVAIDNCDGEITGTGNRSLIFSTSGTITWTFTDSNQNSSTVTQEIIINQIGVTVDTEDILCNGFATGEAQAIVTGGVAPFTYNWGALGTGPSKDGLSPGTYDVTVTDTNGCTANQQFTITEPDSFIEITDVIIDQGCHGQNDAQLSFTATGGTAPLTYFLNNVQVPGTTIDNLAPGTYIIKVVDGNGCSQEETVTITAPEQLVITDIVTTETHTFGSSTGSATVLLEGGTPNYTFQWSDGQTTQIASNLAAGEYSVTVTDANGCTATDTVIVIDPLEAAMLPVSKCLSDDGGLRTSTFQVESVRGGIAPYTYHWDFGGETTTGVSTAAGEGVHVVDYVASGTYTITLTVTDSAGNKFVEVLDYYVGECFEACGQTSNLDFVDSFYVGKEDGTILSSSECESYTGRVYIYLNIEKNANAYNPSVEFIYTIEDPQTLEVISEERITGCVPMEGDGKIPEIFRIGEVTNWSCGYAVNLQNFYMDWTNGSHKPCGDVRQRMCVSTNEQDEIQFPLSATVNVTHIFCHGSKEGVIQVNASGGAGVYSYEVLNTQTGEIITQSTYLFENLPAGIYDVTVRGDIDSFTRTGIEIKQPASSLVLKEIDNTPLVCNGGNDATSTVQASGGTAPYTIVWDHISQTSTEDTGTATNLSAGFYTVRVVDNNGCEFSTQIEVVAPPVAVADAGPDQTLGCGVDQVSLGAVFEDYINPATGEMEFGTWTVVNGPSGSTFSNVNAPDTVFSITATGTYTLRWTVPCGAYDDVKITFINCSTIDFDGQDDYIDFSNNYDLSGDFTLEAWIKQNPTTSAGIRTVLSKKDVSNSAAGGFDLVIENNVPKFRWNGGSISSDYPIGTDRWYHLAVIKGGTDEGIYVDGIKVSASIPGAPAASSSPFLIGAAYDSISSPLPNNFFHGWIEEVRIWNAALNLTQLRFMMNQRIINNTNVRGEVIPLDVPDGLNWSSLRAYYRLLTAEATNGITTNRVDNGIHGRLKNIQTSQANTAPLPYVSGSTGTWDENPWMHWDVWDAPNSVGIDGLTAIEWNIAELHHDISSGSRDITLLGLISEKGRLSISKSGNPANEFDPGQNLRVTKYLELNGNIDLIGESQLLQDEGSILEESSSGYVERDQQGTASSFNYNYWSSPVAPVGTANNSPYTVKQVLRDGSDPANPISLVFNNSFQFADWNYTGAKRISSYWLHIYTNYRSNTYSQWQHIGENGSIKAGEGYSMKGTSGSAEISARQNYTFTGKPNNGTITLPLSAGNDYLVGNPYPSAIDSKKFILDNISDSGGNNSTNVFNGTLYFWDHFGGRTHYLKEYVGGYATLNLSGGIVAIATDERINNDLDENGEYRAGNEKPLQYIPVGQGYFISTQLSPDLSEVTTVSGGDILFKNSQRVFITDDQPDDLAVFKSMEKTKPQQQKIADSREKIWIKFSSPGGYHRQILVTKDSLSSDGFDLGFDGPLIENNKEDMYWIIDNSKFVIQGVPDFNKDREMPFGIKTAVEGEFTIAIDELQNIPDEMEIYVKDSLTQLRHDIREAAFVATDTAGIKDERYYIVFQKQSTPDTEEGDGETGEEDNEDKNEEEDDDAGIFEVFYSNNDNAITIKNPDLIIIESGALFSILGQKIQDFWNVPTQKSTNLPVREIPPGVYLVKLETEIGSKTVKFVKE